MQRYPKVVVDLEKIEENTRLLVEKCKKSDMDVMGVTKVFCAFPEIAGAMVKGGISYIADSRITNLKKLKDYDVPKVLLRLPMQSEAEELVDLVDISLNSEIETIRIINESALKAGKVHKIILMMELGDLREGILPEDIKIVLDEVVKLENIKVAGLGVNLTCYGGVIPSENNLGELVELSKMIERDYGIKLEIISGGNSSSLYLIDEGKVPAGVNNLRLGEAIALGRETAYGERVAGANTDSYILQAEIIELKSKPSIPRGVIGMDAFGNKPQFEDRGIRKRAILAVGRQDMDPDGLIPKDPNVVVIGASSDHLIIDVQESANNYKVGDILSFELEYGALLKIMTSEYISKDFLT